MEKIEEIINLIDAHQKKETKKVLKKYLNKWYWFVLFCMLGIALGFYIFKNSPDIYEINSRILVVDDNQGLNSVLSFNNPMMSMMKNPNIENKIGILKSYTLFNKALSNLNWETSWYQKKLLYKKELYKNEPFELVLPPNAINAQNVLIELVALNEKEYQVLIKGETNLNEYPQTIDIDMIMKYDKPFLNEFFNFKLKKGRSIIGETYYLKFNNLNTLTNNYLKKTKISLEDLNSGIINISIKGANKQKEADFINELNNVFIRFGIDNKKTNSDKSLEFIESQLSRIKTNLKSAEEKFSNYRRNKQVINLSQEGQLIYQKLEELGEEIYMTQLQVDYYKNLIQYIDDSEKISDMINPSIIGITDAGLNNMLSKLMDLYGRREILSYSVKEKSPSFQILEKEIIIARDALEETVRNQLKTTELILASAEERYSSMENRVKQLPETEKELIGIQREFDLNDELYTYLLRKRAEASISKASIAPEVQVIDPARVEASIHMGPSLVKNVGVGLAGGLFIPFLFITLAGFFNSKIESKEEIEKSTQLPVLEGIMKHRYKERLPVIYHPRSGIAESFRGVKTNINTILEQTECKVVSVNSLIPGEGKSFVSSNLSATLAKSNVKTLLLGADMHKPTLHKYFDFKEADGLSNYFKNDIEIEEIISKTPIPYLSFIQAGPVPQNQSDPINGPKFEYLLQTARTMFDFIIIDNAPLLLIPDAILTSKISDMSLFILRINYSHKDQIQQINKIVNFNKLKQAAVITNGLPVTGYGYGYKYYKKGYGEYRSKMSIAR